jgi:hypothetical protein
MRVPLSSWQVPQFDGEFMLPTLGAAGRITTAVSSSGYLISLLNDAVDTSPKFPLLFGVVSDVACRVRQRRVTSETAIATATVEAALAAAGAVQVAVSGDVSRHMTLVNASLAAAGGVFDTIGSNAYGPLVPANVVFPIVVRSMRDAWLQVRAYDATGTESLGEFHFFCMNDPTLIGS